MFLGECFSFCVCHGSSSNETSHLRVNEMISNKVRDLRFVDFCNDFCGVLFII